MLFRIEYFRDDLRLEDTPWSGTLDETVTLARAGMIRLDADFAHIVADVGHGTEVWSARRIVERLPRYQKPS